MCSMSFPLDAVSGPLVGPTCQYGEGQNPLLPPVHRSSPAPFSPCRRPHQPLRTAASGVVARGSTAIPSSLPSASHGSGAGVGREWRRSRDTRTALLDLHSGRAVHLEQGRAICTEVVGSQDKMQRQSAPICSAANLSNPISLAFPFVLIFSAHTHEHKCVSVTSSCSSH
jgi:hypothetical protein